MRVAECAICRDVIRPGTPVAVVERQRVIHVLCFRPAASETRRLEQVRLRLSDEDLPPRRAPLSAA